MSNFALEIWDNETERVTFYTVRKQNATENETDKFVYKFAEHPDFRPFLEEIISLLFYKIGDEYGARHYFFKRNENEVTALPPGRVSLSSVTLSYADNPLRLYCLRLSDELVILFNGAEKTSQKAQDGKTSMSFYEANSFAKIINEALQDKTIEIKGRDIISFDNQKNHIEL